MPSKFLIIPTEIIEHALTFTHATDVVAFAQTCRLAFNLIFHSEDQHLWRQLYLLYPFDDPRVSPVVGQKQHPHSFDWMNELLRRCKAERIALHRENHPPEDCNFALEIFITVLETAPSADIIKQSDNLRWLTHVLQKSRILDASFTDNPETMKLQAQLRSYCAPSVDDTSGNVITQERLKARRTSSRQFIYDLRNHRASNKWGPFHSDGTVNWVHMDAIITAVIMNIHELPAPLRLAASPPVGLEASRPYSAPSWANRAAIDWAGVEGTWGRYICIIDHHDLYEYNHWNISFNGPRNVSVLEEPFSEVTRLLLIKIRLVPPEVLRFRSIPDNLSAYSNPEYPPLFFAGISRGLGGGQAAVEGMVTMDKDHTIRWQFSTRYGGDMHWSSEGVQIGGICSATGVVGVFTTETHDPGDLFGPFWLWKFKDNMIDESALE